MLTGGNNLCKLFLNMTIFKETEWQETKSASVMSQTRWILKLLKDKRSDLEPSMSFQCYEHTGLYLSTAVFQGRYVLMEPKEKKF